MQKEYAHIAVFWIPLAIVITALSGLIYLTVQQSLRLGANDPQIQIAQHAVYDFTHGETVPLGISARPIPMAQSLDTFVIIYSTKGDVLYSNTQLHGKTPKLPQGVLAYTKAHQQDRLTWEPQAGVRIAAVVMYYHGLNQTGYILVGRSLREIEKREQMLTVQVVAGWLITLFASLLAVIVLHHIVSYKKHSLGNI